MTGPSSGWNMGTSPARLGLALGGGFARGMAHIGVLQVFEEEQIPIGRANSYRLYSGSECGIPGGSGLCERQHSPGNRARG